MEGGAKCARITEIRKLEEAADGRERGGGGGVSVGAEVWRTGAAHMQLREQICAGEYANSRFVSAAASLPVQRAAAGEGRQNDEPGSGLASAAPGGLPLQWWAPARAVSVAHLLVQSQERTPVLQNVAQLATLRVAGPERRRSLTVHV